MSALPSGLCLRPGRYFSFQKSQETRNLRRSVREEVVRGAEASAPVYRRQEAQIRAEKNGKQYGAKQRECDVCLVPRALSRRQRAR